MATIRIKVYELAKELGIEPQTLVSTVQRMGIDVKTSTNFLGTEEVRLIREHYKKSKPLAKVAKAAPPAKPAGVTEKRVGATVIRRRASQGATPPPEEVKSELPPEEVQPVVEETAPPQPEETFAPEAPSAPVEEPEVAPIAAEAEKKEEVVAAPAPTPPAATPVEPPKKPAAPSRKVEVTPEKTRRFFPSIIKKVGTEQYLGEKIGPKMDRPVRPATAAGDKTAAKPGTTTTATSATGAAGLTGPRRVREVDLGFSETAAAKEAAKRRLMERQSTVFKSADYLKRELVHSTKKKKTVVARAAQKTQITTPAEHKRIIEMGDTISVSALAKELSTKAGVLIGKLMAMGVTATINQEIDHETATLVVQEYGYEIRHKVVKEEDFITNTDIKEERLKPRPPVVTIMGHVDHGKTSLLDNIRKAKVAAGEAGGITQHVGAYTVQMPKGKITFVDTPGHEAFTAMRARGAKVTDIVILVVSATDGVMPQTLESVSHAKAAGVPIIVAVNKIDLPDAQPDRVKQTLVGHELTPEEWGGETIYVNVSAKTGKGVDQLLESILLQAEMLELKADYEASPRGVVIESRLDKTRGPLGSLLVQQGTLKTGDIIVAGSATGKIRAMMDSTGKRVPEAFPGDPVEILGLSSVPAVGEGFVVCADEQNAREIVALREQKTAGDGAGRVKPSLESLMAGEGTEKELRLILKSDVQGSAEALKEAIGKMPATKVKSKLLHVGTGGITESDIMLATASGAVILGFNVRPDVKAQKLAEAEKVDVRTYTIIYDMLDDVKKLLEGLLDKVVTEKVIGRAEIRDIFQVPKIGTIAGSAVIDGKVTRGCFLRLLRDSRVIYEGKLSSLKRFKEDVKEVASGYECGIAVENFNDLKRGDHFEAFIKEEQKGSLA